MLEPLPLLRGCLRATLAAHGYRVLGEADVTPASVEALATLNPGVVLLAIEPDDDAGLEALREIRRRCPQATTVVLSTHLDPESATALTAAGATTTISKQEELGYLLDRLAAVAGDQHLRLTARSPAFGKEPLDRTIGSSYAGPLARLTTREREVSLLIARGLTNKEIGADLHVTPITVRNHLSNVMRKLGVRSRAEVATLVALEGWI